MRMNKRITWIAVVCVLAGCLTNAVSYASDIDSMQTGSTYAIVTSQSTPAPAASPYKKVSSSATPAVAPSPAPSATIAATSLATPGETPGPVPAQMPSETPDAAPAVTPSLESSATPASTPEIQPTPTPVDDESLWYREKLPLKKEHQKLLWGYCKTRELDYIDMLALIATESNFNENACSGKYKGYFQISTSNSANLAKTLKTLNKPLDGAININWGTAMYSWILADKRLEGIDDEKDRRDIALSIYQRGSGGYDKYGLSSGFLKIFYKKRGIVSAYFEDDKAEETDKADKADKE